MEEISLENIEDFAIPFSQSPMKWVFEDEEEKLSTEFLDQIIPLSKRASSFLCKFEHTQKHLYDIDNFKKYFSQNESIYIFENEAKIKKWLYERKIAFDQKVFWSNSNDSAFILTWKMIIKFWESIFRQDQIIWDKTLNWTLVYTHDYLYFAKNFNKKMYQNDMTKEKVRQTILVHISDFLNGTNVSEEWAKKLQLLISSYKSYNNVFFEKNEHFFTKLNKKISSYTNQQEGVKALCIQLNILLMKNK